MAVEIRKVRTDRDRKEFFDLPFRIYRNNSYWVPPIIKEEKEQFESHKNPILEDCTIERFIAEKDREVVGRIVGILNHIEIDASEQVVGRFGWLESIDDPQVFSALFAAVERWALEQNVDMIKGPYGFTNLDKSAMLIDGFDEIGSMGTIYNHPYYKERVEELGYEKLIDYFEFEFNVPSGPSDRLERMVELISDRYGVRLAQFSSRNGMMEHSKGIFKLMNKAYDPIEGFVPFPMRWIEQYSKKFMRFLNHEYVSVVLDESDEVVGFGISLPRFSRALQKSKGKLWPLGWLYLWKTYYFHDTTELVLIAVHPEFQNKGIHALIFKETINAFVNNGVVKVHAYPQLESNKKVQQLFKNYNNRKNKTRRVFIKDLQKSD